MRLVCRSNATFVTHPYLGRVEHSVPRRQLNLPRYDRAYQEGRRLQDLVLGTAVRTLLLLPGTPSSSLAAAHWSGARASFVRRSMLPHTARPQLPTCF